jgi:hypothetical protein
MYQDLDQHPGKLTDSIILAQDNAYPHAAQSSGSTQCHAVEGV